MGLEEAPCDVDAVENHNSSFPNRKGKEIEVKAAPENYKILDSPERGSKRKRGRPAHTSLNKGKSTVNQARRARARIGRKPARISGNESEESGSHDSTSLGEEVDVGERIHGMVGQESIDIQENEAMKEPESLQRGKAVEQDVAEDIRIEEPYKIPEIKMMEKHNVQESEKPEELEATADPVEAMLFDMIPSLGMKKAETTYTSTRDEKPAPDPIPNAGPSKKKKVSYKDIASELLKDW